MLLEVLICTIDARIVQAAEVLLPPQPGVCYLVSWQHTQAAHAVDVPRVLHKRDDVRVITLNGKGLARNRNFALQHAQGDVLLLADDDVRLEATALQKVVAYFEQQPHVDIITTCAKHTDGTWHKYYPSQAFDLQYPPRGYYVSSVELALRRSTRLPRFDERFGLGSAELASGEEEVFLADCLRTGLVGVFLPYHMVTLPDANTTGAAFDTEVKVRRSKGAVLAYLHGYCGAILRGLKFSLSYCGTLSRWHVFRDLLWGIHYIIHQRE